MWSFVSEKMLSNDLLPDCHVGSTYFYFLSLYPYRIVEIKYPLCNVLENMVYGRGKIYM